MRCSENGGIRMGEWCFTPPITYNVAGQMRRRPPANALAWGASGTGEPSQPGPKRAHGQADRGERMCSLVEAREDGRGRGPGDRTIRHGNARLLHTRLPNESFECGQLGKIEKLD